MQLLIAYAFDNDLGNGVADRFARVTAHYNSLWEVPVKENGFCVSGMGIQMWDAANSPWLWPSWQESQDLSVGTVYRPLGYERVVGDLPLEDSPVVLARTLLKHPKRVGDMNAPFVFAVLEKEAERLTLMTDALGLGNLYQLRFPDGWVWSNRPAAAVLFAGIRATADLIGWRTFAASSWFMGDRTPFEHVYVVPAGAQVGYERPSGHFESRIDFLANWTVGQGGRPLDPERLDEVSEGLKQIARSLQRMRPAPITIGLSGGRDSRLVAGAFLAAGVEMGLYTKSALPKEADISRQLVAALPDKLSHRIDEGQAIAAGAAGASSDAPPTLERTMGWHRIGEGLRPAALMPTPPPTGLRYSDTIWAMGAFGEIGHRVYRLGDLSDFEHLSFGRRFDLFVERLIKRLAQSGVSSQANEAAAWELRKALMDAARAGIDDHKVVNYWYASERLRRWGSMEDRADIATPLLIPEFFRSCFELTDEQREQVELHRALTARLVPEWAEIPYYRRDQVKEVMPAWWPRLAFAPDRDLISAIVDDPSSWGENYDVPLIQQWWRLLRTEPREGAERAIQNLIWRAVFEDFLSDLNGEERVVRRPAFMPEQPGAIHRARRFTARALNKVARTVDLPVDAWRKPTRHV